MTTANSIDSSVSTDGESYSYTYTSNLSFAKEIKPASADVYVRFSDNISERKYHTEKVDLGYGYSWDREVFDGIAFSRAKVDMLGFQFKNEGKLKGKTKAIYDKLAAAFKKLGKEVKHSKNATLFDLGNKHYAVVIRDNTAAGAIYGTTTENLNSIDLSQYDDGAEVADEAAVDSVSYDTAVADSAYYDGE